jgi:hypothetical protein
MYTVWKNYTYLRMPPAWSFFLSNLIWYKDWSQTRASFQHFFK